MIKTANNEKDYKDCLEYLKQKEIFPLTYTNLFFVIINDKIIAVAGLNKDTGATIDPFVSDSALASIELFRYLEGMLTGLGYRHIQIFTNNNTVIKKLIESEGFRKVNTEAVSLIKEI